VVGAENNTALAGHVDSSPCERTVAFWDLDHRCGELKCGFLVRDAEKHGNQGSHRLVAKWPLPRQLVAEGFPKQEDSVTARQKPSALQRPASWAYFATRSPVLGTVEFWAN